jgi:DNA-binding response OmpR family regulator
MKPLILVVDDDFNIRDLLSGYLQKSGYEVVTASDGPSALDLAEERRPALVVLDVLLGGDMDGYEICRVLRARSRVPVLLLTSLGADAQQITGLEAGADDYVVKPFSLRQVVARIRAILRRAGLVEGDRLEFGPLTLNATQRRVTVNGEPVALTGHEFALLEALMRRPERIFTREDLLNQCWEASFDGTDRVVDVHLASLRRKLGPAAALITTVRGVGYRFERPTS